MIIVATEYKDRVSVRKEILMKIQNYIEFGCYEQAVEMLGDLCDDNERRKAKHTYEVEQGGLAAALRFETMWRGSFLYLT